MRHIKNRSHFSSSSKSRKPFFVLGVLALIVLVIVAFFGGGNKDGSDVLVGEMEEESGIVGESVDETNEEPAVEVVEDDDELFQQIDLTAVDGNVGSGIARRGVSGDLFSHVVVAELPPIDGMAFFYEGWLVKPGVVEFFSTGEMFIREDDKWGLLWETDLLNARADLMEFEKVVITLEPRDGDPAPAPDHIIEGIFETVEE